MCEYGDFSVGGFKLVIAVAIGNLPSAFRVAEGTGAETDSLGRDAEIVEEGGHNVGLLHQAIIAYVGVGSVVRLGQMDNQRNAVPSIVIVICTAESLSAVVCCDEEKRVGIPIGLPCGIEEFSQGIVAVRHHLAEGVGTFGELAHTVGLHSVRVVRG